MSRMSELHYNKRQEDSPYIEYIMRYQGKFNKWTPRVETWYNKKYANPKKAKPNYIKARKAECPF